MRKYWIVGLIGLGIEAVLITLHIFHIEVRITDYISIAVLVFVVEVVIHVAESQQQAEQGVDELRGKLVPIEEALRHLVAEVANLRRQCEGLVSGLRSGQEIAVVIAAINNHHPELSRYIEPALEDLHMLAKGDLVLRTRDAVYEEDMRLIRNLRHQQDLLSTCIVSKDIKSQFADPMYVKYLQEHVSAGIRRVKVVRIYICINDSIARDRELHEHLKSLSEMSTDSSGLCGMRLLCLNLQGLVNIAAMGDYLKDILVFDARCSLGTPGQHPDSFFTALYTSDPARVSESRNQFYRIENASQDWKAFVLKFPPDP